MLHLLTCVLHTNLPHAALHELSREASQLLREIGVWANLRQVLKADRGGVHRVPDLAGGEKVHHLLGNGGGHANLRFGGGRAKMRSADYLIKLQERALGGRLLREHIKPGACNLTAHDGVA